MIDDRYDTQKTVVILIPKTMFQVTLDKIRRFRSYTRPAKRTGSVIAPNAVLKSLTQPLLVSIFLPDHDSCSLNGLLCYEEACLMLVTLRVDRSVDTSEDMSEVLNLNITAYICNHVSTDETPHSVQERTGKSPSGVRRVDSKCSSRRGTFFATLLHIEPVSITCCTWAWEMHRCLLLGSLCRKMKSRVKYLRKRSGISERSPPT